MLGPNTAVTETYLVIDRFENQKTANLFAAYLRTRFVRFLISLQKYTQHLYSDRFSFVPDLPMNRKWTDELLYEKYGITIQANACICTGGDDDGKVVPEHILSFTEQVRHRLARSDIGQEPECMLQVRQQTDIRVREWRASPRLEANGEKLNFFFGQNSQVLIHALKTCGIFEFSLLALPPVRKAICGGFDTKTITLSCGKLTTGVTVPQWSSILMLRNLSSPETYFQAAFRVQSPWSIKNPNGDNPNEEEILKPVCFVFDFAPTRALRQISEYGIGLAPNEPNPENAVKDLVSFLPVLAYTGIESHEGLTHYGLYDTVVAKMDAT